MSEIVKEVQSVNGIACVVKTDDGDMYMVSSVNTYDMGPETMAFEWDEKNDSVANWGGEFEIHYQTERQMRKGHLEVCENLEKYLEVEHE